MAGVLLDTHAFYWLVSGEEPLTEQALVAIGESQAANSLFVSPITAWELSIAANKGNHARRPNLGQDSPDRWFGKAVRATAARIVPVRQRISCEAANVVARTGHKDPGDCFLIATARVRRVPLITRDGLIRAIAEGNDGFLDVIEC